VDRLYAYALSALVLVVVGWPATRRPEADGFPLSTYPMFARPRARVNDVTSALALAADGARAPIPPRFVANAEAMQAISTLRQSVAQGPRASRALCEAIAGRVAAAHEPELRTARQVEIVTGRVDAIDYLAGRATPRTRRLHARCDVKRGVP
jgi:hypothetical protein